MVTIDERLLDATCVENLEENFNRILALIDGISGEEGTVAALAARVTALDDEDTGAVPALAGRVTALEEAQNTSSGGEGGT